MMKLALELMKTAVAAAIVALWLLHAVAFRTRP